MHWIGCWLVHSLEKISNIFYSTNFPILDWRIVCLLLFRFFLRNNLISEIELSRELILYFTISLFLLFLLKLLFCTYSLQCIYKYLCMLPNLVPCLATSMFMKKGTQLVGQCHKCHSTDSFSATVPPRKFSWSKSAPRISNNFLLHRIRH